MLSGAPAWMQGVAAMAGLAITVLALIGVLQPRPPPPDGHDVDEEALLRSVVKVQMMSGGTMVGWGSGTVISDDGLILTNAHVATPSDRTLDDLIIAVTAQSDALPEAGYHAEVIAADSVLDLAVIKITTNMGGGPYDGALEPIPTGDSNDLEIGDELTFIGYPLIGGETITLTHGYVSGFLPNPTLGARAWIKTDGTIAGGNSGGLAANDAGELIGVPSQAGAGDSGEIADCRKVTDTNRDGVINEDDDCIPIGGFLNSLRPSNLAQAMLAAIESGVAYEPLGGLPDAVVDPNPEPTGFNIDEATFERPIFTDVQPPDDASFIPEDDPVSIASGATELCAWWEYSGMANGVAYSAVWSLDGEVQESVSYLDEVWIGGESGSWWVCVVDDGGITDGMWDLGLSVEKTVLTGGFVGVGDYPAPVTLTLNNDGPETICFLYVSPATSTIWGADRLGQEGVLLPDEGLNLELLPASYDLWGGDCEGTEIFRDQQGIFADVELIY